MKEGGGGGGGEGGGDDAVTGWTVDGSRSAAPGNAGGPAEQSCRLQSHILQAHLE